MFTWFFSSTIRISYTDLFFANPVQFIHLQQLDIFLRFRSFKSKLFFFISPNQMHFVFFIAFHWDFSSSLLQFIQYVAYILTVCCYFFWFSLFMQFLLNHCHWCRKIMLKKELFNDCAQFNLMMEKWQMEEHFIIFLEQCKELNLFPHSVLYASWK